MALCEEEMVAEVSLFGPQAMEVVTLIIAIVMDIPIPFSPCP